MTLPKTVVVIGSNSFSGSDFIDLLLSERDYRIIGVSRSPEASDLFLPYLRNDDLERFRFHQLDLNDDADRIEDLLTNTKPEYIVNFASQSEVAPSWNSPEQWFRTNAVSTARLGNFLRKQDWLTRYVHISTPEVYGSCQGVVREDQPLNPSTPYAASRAAGEMMLRVLFKEFGLPVVMTRASNVYGAHQQLFKIIPRTAIYLRLGRTLELHGGGQQVRSFIHIRDVSRGELAIMESGRDGEIYNLSPDDKIRIRDLVEMICKASGRILDECTTEVPARPGNDAVYTIDSSKARHEFRWRPEISIEEGVADVNKWVERNWARIREAPLEYVHKP